MKPVGHRATHSVWNARTLAWDYYRAPMSGLRDGVMAPKPGGPRHNLGITPEEAARPLPAGAVHLGSGLFARGMVAERRPFLSMGGLAHLDHPFVVGAVAVVALCAWYFSKET